MVSVALADPPEFKPFPMRSYRPDGPRLVNAAVLESRLEKLEAISAN